MSLKRSWNIGPLVLTATVGVSGILLVLGLDSPAEKTRDERFREAVAVIEECDGPSAADEPPLLPVVDVDGTDRYARYRTYVPVEMIRDGKVERLRCGNCGRILPEEAKFCPNCGTKIAPFSVSDEPPSPDVEPAPPTPD